MQLLNGISDCQLKLCLPWSFISLSWRYWILNFCICMLCNLVNKKKTESEIIKLPCLSFSLLNLPQQAVRSKHFELRLTPTLRHRWGESSLSLLWQGAKKMWLWLRGRSCLQLSTSPSSERLETRRALCLLSPVQGPPLYLDRRPFRSVSLSLWVMVSLSVKDMKRTF